ncbi:MAG: hypothetical protein V3R96_02840 [Dehalococcoidales bacterium]
MFPTYLAILSAIEESGELSVKQLYGVTDVRGKALRHICDSLVHHGYLELYTSGGYSITSTGKEALLESLNEVSLGPQVIN